MAKSESLGERGWGGRGGGGGKLWLPAGSDCIRLELLIFWGKEMVLAIYPLRVQGLGLNIERSDFEVLQYAGFTAPALHDFGHESRNSLHPRVRDRKPK